MAPKLLYKSAMRLLPDIDAYKSFTHLLTNSKNNSKLPHDNKQAERPEQVRIHNRYIDKCAQPASRSVYRGKLCVTLKF